MVGKYDVVGDETLSKNCSVLRIISLTFSLEMEDNDDVVWDCRLASVAEAVFSVCSEYIRRELIKLCD